MVYSRLRSMQALVASFLEDPHMTAPTTQPVSLLASTSVSAQIRTAFPQSLQCTQPTGLPPCQQIHSQCRFRLGWACMPPDSPEAAQDLSAAIEQFPGPRPRGMHSTSGPASGDSMDLVVGEIVETVRNMRNEASLLRYLRALAALQGARLLPRTRRITRIRLQVAS